MLKNVMRPFTDVVIINNLQRLELSCPCSVIARICGKGEVRGGDGGGTQGGLEEDWIEERLEAGGLKKY